MYNTIILSLDVRFEYFKFQTQIKPEKENEKSSFLKIAIHIFFLKIFGAQSRMNRRPWVGSRMILSKMSISLSALSHFSSQSFAWCDFTTDTAYFRFGHAIMLGGTGDTQTYTHQSTVLQKHYRLTSKCFATMYILVSFTVLCIHTNVRCGWLCIVDCIALSNKRRMCEW